MSQRFPAEIDCPNCKHQQTVELWKSLNAQVDPEALEAFRSGRINLFVCQECGYRARVPIEFMYHDMDRRMSVLLIPFEQLSEPETLERFDRYGKLQMNIPELARSMMEKTGGDYITNPVIALSMEEMIAQVYFREVVWDYHQK